METGPEGIPSSSRRLPRRGAFQGGAGRVQHRQVREDEAQDGSGGGRHAGLRHPGAPQELEQPLPVSELADLSSAAKCRPAVVLPDPGGDGS